MHSEYPTHEGLERIIRVLSAIQRGYRALRQAFAIQQPAPGKDPAHSGT